MNAYAVCRSVQVIMIIHELNYLKFQRVYSVFQKSDAKIEITITAAYLIRIKYPFSGLNYNLSV